MVWKNRKIYPNQPDTFTLGKKSKKEIANQCQRMRVAFHFLTRKGVKILINSFLYKKGVVIKHKKEVQKVASPLQKDASPLQNVFGALQKVASRLQKVTSPLQNVFARLQKVASPLQKVASPLQNVFARLQKVALPLQKVFVGFQKLPYREKFMECCNEACRKGQKH